MGTEYAFSAGATQQATGTPVCSDQYVVGNSSFNSWLTVCVDEVRKLGGGEVEVVVVGENRPRTGGGFYAVPDVSVTIGGTVVFRQQFEISPPAEFEDKDSETETRTATAMVEPGTYECCVGIENLDAIQSDDLA